MKLVLGAYQNAVKKHPVNVSQWETNGQPKIVVKTDSLEELLALHEKAKSKNIPTKLICDAGRTQIAPNTNTVCAIGPGKASEINEITGHLKLL